MRNTGQQNQTESTTFENKKFYAYIGCRSYNGKWRFNGDFEVGPWDGRRQIGPWVHFEYNNIAYDKKIVYFDSTVTEKTSSGNNSRRQLLLLNKIMFF